LSESLQFYRVKNQSSVSAYQYEKTKIVGFKANALVNQIATATHGITDWHTIKSWTCVLHEDSLNLLIVPGHYFGATVLYYAIVDSLNCQVNNGSAATSIKSDSVFFKIVYTDFSR